MCPGKRMDSASPGSVCVRRRSAGSSMSMDSNEEKNDRRGMWTRGCGAGRLVEVEDRGEERLLRVRIRECVRERRRAAQYGGASEERGDVSRWLRRTFT